MQGVAASIASADTTYYVAPPPLGNDTNGGTTTSVPFATITKAVETMGAGDTTVVMDGTYVESVIEFKTSGSSGLPITLRASRKKRWCVLPGCTPGGRR